MPKTDARIQKIRENQPNLENEKKIQANYEERLKYADDLFQDLAYQQHPELHFQINPEDFSNKAVDSQDQATLAEKVLNFDKDLYKDKVLNQMSQAPPLNLSVINNEKRRKILTLCTMIYNENELVGESVENIKSERDNIVNRLNNIMEYPEVPGDKASESFISSHQVESLRSYLSYVDKNHDSLPPEIISEVRENKAFQVIKEYYSERTKLNEEVPSDTKLLEETLKTRISNSQNEIMEELAKGYQWLLQSLERREKVLQHRLDRLLKDYGGNDRILAEDLDYKNELENIDFGSPFDSEDRLKHEDIVSISEQMRNITEWKNETSRRKLKDRDDPMWDYETPNFNQYDIDFAEITPRTIDLIQKKTLTGENVSFDPYKSRSHVRNNYDDEVFHGIMKRINKARDNYETPFDEMYHKEKALIDNVVKAEKELIEAQDAAQAQLEKYTGSVEHLFDNNIAGLYENEDDIRVLLKKSNTQNDSADSLFAEDMNRNYQDLVVDLIGDKNAEKYLDQQTFIQNMGYCFITFSHTDEAKKCIMRGDKQVFDTNEVSVYLKNDLGHEDFNIDYLKARTISDSKIIDKKINLEKARSKLETYEKNFERSMPKASRLRRMKEAAKDAIDDNYFYDRSAFPRSEREEELLKYKIQDMEKRTGTDFAPLLDSVEKEKERIQRHKKAFETYKSYSFLKAGLQKTGLEKELTQDVREGDEYKFPEPEKIAKVFLNEDYKYSMLKEGEVDNRSGRKFKFTPRDYLNKYFGKDLYSGNHIDVSGRPMYSFNDEMKRQYPYSSISSNPIDHLEKYQEKSIENSQRRDSLTSSEMDPLWLEEIVQEEKNRQSRPNELKFEEIIENNPFVGDKPFKERIEEAIKNTQAPDGKLNPLLKIIFRN